MIRLIHLHERHCRNCVALAGVTEMVNIQKYIRLNMSKNQSLHWLTLGFFLNTLLHYLFLIVQIYGSTF